jgi:hypothetical protein
MKNRAAPLPLLIAAALAALLAACAQPNPNAGVGADADAALPAFDLSATASAPAPASAASTANAASNGPDDDSAFDQWAGAERHRIATGRAAANDRYNQDARLCWQRFAVNACLQKAHDRRRAVLVDLRHDELLLNASLRQRRTAARLDEIARKQAQQPQSDDTAPRNDPQAPAPTTPPSPAP